MEITGFTEDEKILNYLATKSFLRFWAWPNLYRNQGKQSATQDGKEICDLIVFFGNDIILFSDKRIFFNKNKEEKIAWSRWYRKAIIESSKQIDGAIRWIKKYPERIFTDKACTKKLPIEIAKELKFHSIIVTHGLEEHFPLTKIEKTIGLSNKIDSDKQLNYKTCIPFVVGNVSETDFFHVFDDYSIKAVLNEFNTVKDFLFYIEERKTFLQCNKKISVSSETDLFQLYFRNFNEKLGKYSICDFLDKNQEIYNFSFGGIQELYKTSEYQYKKEADQVGFFLDDLISCFSFHTLNDSTDWKNWKQPSEVEPSLRYLANTSRFERRIISETFIEFYYKVAPMTRGTRLAFKIDEKGDAILFLALPKNDEFKNDSQAYRKVRRTLLRDYCMAYKYLKRYINRICGIAFKSRDINQQLTRDFLNEGQDYLYIDFTDDDDESIKLYEDSYYFLKENKLISDIKYIEITHNEFSDDAD